MGIPGSLPTLSSDAVLRVPSRVAGPTRRASRAPHTEDLAARVGSNSGPRGLRASPAVLWRSRDIGLRPGIAWAQLCPRPAAVPTKNHRASYACSHCRTYARSTMEIAPRDNRRLSYPDFEQVWFPAARGLSALSPHRCGTPFQMATPPVRSSLNNPYDHLNKQSQQAGIELERRHAGLATRRLRVRG